LLGAYGSAAAICAASLVVGEAILTLCGRRTWSWLGPAVGLAMLLLTAGLAIHLPGHGGTAAAALLVLTLAGALVLWRWPPEDWRLIVDGIAPALLALLAASIPFALSGHVGILGVGLVNDDMASHLVMADWLQHQGGDAPRLIDDGYPVGPHALVAALGSGLHISLVDAFAGLTLVIPPLAALTSLALLDPLSPVRRTVAATLVALPYLVAAYLAQGAFKEPIEALLVLAFALLLPEPPLPRPAPRAALWAVPAGIVAAAAVYNYSFPGLFWLAGTLGVWALVGAIRGPKPSVVAALRRASSLLPAVMVLIAVLLVATVPDWSRIAIFADFRAFGDAHKNNLQDPLSPLEALGIWPTGEFRLSPADSSLPAAAFYACAAVAAAALVVGLGRWLPRGKFAVPAALAAAAVIYVIAAAVGSPYTSAKALVVAAPLVTLIALGALLGGDEGGPRRLLLWVYGVPVLGVAMAAGAAASSFLVLRQAPVAADAHAAELAKLRPLVEDEQVLFLGRDDFIAYELRGARISTHLGNYFLKDHNVREVRRRPGPAKFDFDAVPPSVLDRFPFVITTRTSDASQPPDHFRVKRSTRNYVLWKRRGGTGRREVLAERSSPGAILDCDRRSGQRVVAGGGTASVWPSAPVERGPRAWKPSAEVSAGDMATQTLKLPAGSWELSLEYDSSRSLLLRSAGSRTRLPANLDYRGTSPYFPAGRVRSDGKNPIQVAVEVNEGNLLARLIGGERPAHLRHFAASPSGGVATVPIARACGRYVDWYRPARGG
jgi:hypothetical protein